MRPENIMYILFCSFVSFLIAESVAIGGTVTINTIPWGEEVYIDGKKIDQNGPETPMIKYPISNGRHAIEVKKKGFPSIIMEIDVVGDEIISGRFSKNDFRIIYGGGLSSAKNIALVIGHNILEEKYLEDIVRYVRNISTIDVVMLFSYKESNYKDELNIQLKSNINNLFQNSRDLETVYYYHRNIGNEKEIEDIIKVMSPYKKKNKALYMQACIFD